MSVLAYELAVQAASWYSSLSSSNARSIWRS